MTTALVLSFAALVLLCALALLWSRWPAWLKALLVVGVTGFYFFADAQVHGLAGWPSRDALPERFVLLAAVIDEPNAKSQGALYVWVDDLQNWQLIVNRQTGQWGLSYDAKQDLGRVKMTMSKPPALVETLKYTITDRGSGKGELRLEWENHVATVPLAVR